MKKSYGFRQIRWIALIYGSIFTRCTVECDTAQRVGSQRIWRVTRNQLESGGPTSTRVLSSGTKYLFYQSPLFVLQRLTEMCGKSQFSSEFHGCVEICGDWNWFPLLHPTPSKGGSGRRARSMLTPVCLEPFRVDADAKFMTHQGVLSGYISCTGFVHVPRVLRSTGSLYEITPSELLNCVH